MAHSTLLPGAPEKSYETLNEDRGYIVEIKSARDRFVHIRDQEGKISLVVSGECYWAGKDRSEEAEGNSILVELIAKGRPLHHYLFIGDKIMYFALEDPVQEFHSPVGNNAYVYAVAFTKNHVHFMDDETSWPKTDFDVDVNAENSLNLGECLIHKHSGGKPLSNCFILHSQRYGAA